METPIDLPCAPPVLDGPPEERVERRVAFQADQAELAIRDTYRPARRVPLRAENPLYCGMVSGVKQIRTRSGRVLSFRPSESLVLPPEETVHVDFPEASVERPTTCFTLEVERERVQRTVEQMNERMPRLGDAHEWPYGGRSICHFRNSHSFTRATQQLVSLFIEDHPDRDRLIDLAIEELLIRMLRTEARHLLLEASRGAPPSHPLGAAIAYARQHIGRTLTTADLAEVACMSEPTFYRHFREETGQTPRAFLTEMRMRHAERLLAESHRPVAEVAEEIGYASTSHFIRLFKRHAGTTPKQYQLARRQEARSEPETDDRTSPIQRERR